MVAKRIRFLLVIIAGAISLSAALLAGRVQAADDPRKFVDALRERRYLDTAAEYLNGLAANPNLASDTKKIVPYEQALVLIDTAAGDRDPQTRDQRLSEAQARLREFLAASADHELGAAAPIG